MLKNKFGITLIALVVTIVVLVVITGVGINLSMSENEILGKAKTAVDKYKEASQNEQIQLSKLGNMIAGNRYIDEAQLETLVNKLVDKKLSEGIANPTGTIISFLGNSGEENKDVPEGYLACDGSIYEIAKYPNLANQIQKTLGTKNYYGGDGETTFAVPDLRGEFLRGTGTAQRNTGTGLAVGVHQDATSHAWFASYSDSVLQVHTATSNGATYVLNPDKTNSTNYFRNYYADIKSTYETAKPSHYTSRPTNTSVLYCIKY